MSYPGEISVFITNYRLPSGVSGRDVAEEILKSRPGLPVLHVAGYPEAQLRGQGMLASGSYYLAKPFFPRQLVMKVNEI